MLASLSPPQSPPGSLPTVASRHPDPAPDGLAGLTEAICERAQRAQQMDSHDRAGRLTEHIEDPPQ